MSLTVEERIEFVKKAEKHFVDSAPLYNKVNPEQDSIYIKEISKMVLKEIPLDDALFDKLQNYSLYRTANEFFQCLFCKYIKKGGKSIHAASVWSIEDDIIQKLLKVISINKDDSIFRIWGFIAEKLKDSEGEKFMNYLLSIGFEKDFLLEKILRSGRVLIYVPKNNREKNKLDYIESGFGVYLRNNLTDEIASYLHEFPTKQLETRGKDQILRFLLLNSKHILNNEFNRYLFTEPRLGNVTFIKASLQQLIECDAENQESIIVKIIEDNAKTTGEIFMWYMMLNKHTNGKYHEQVLELGEKGFDAYKGNHSGVQEYHDPLTYSKYLLDYDSESGKTQIRNFVKEAEYLGYRYFEFLDEIFQEDVVSMILKFLTKKRALTGSIQLGTIFPILQKYDSSKYLGQVISYAVQLKNKAPKRTTIDFLAKYVDQITPEAIELTKGKKIDERIVGAIILGKSEDKKVKNYLLELVDKEKNDDTRDLLLESLSELKFAKPLSYDQVLEMIDKADKRKKLSKWGEKWIEEESLPKLMWKNGDALTPTQIRFLFYRFKRAKGLNSDIEARQVFQQLDKSQSGDFANALLKGFQDSNAATKFKYYMTNAGLIGGDEALSKLNTLFNSCVTNKRWKLAEYVVVAIAMVGSNKALRIVELISRKYNSKRPRISASAKDAMNAAAVELKITTDQLADQIIPDFGFEDLYKTFDAGDDTYRAFVSKDFKLEYFNEDNKRRKSIPKNTPKEMVKELKEIDKEIKAVVKAQKGRLENCLIVERQWTIEEWEKYYRNHPIMLIYVQKLLWALFKENELITPFYCDEDIDLYDFNDEEIDLEKGDNIKILHPLHLTETQLQKWKQKVYDMDIALEFPILNREIMRKNEDELDLNYTKEFFGNKIPKGADYVVSYLSRKGWIKETGDGGHVYFHKKNPDPKIRVSPNIEGPMAWYQGGNTPAVINQVTFYGKKKGQRITLEDVPEVFYSEVIGELKQLINAE